MVAVSGYTADPGALTTMDACLESRNQIAAEHVVAGGAISRVGNGVALRGGSQRITLLYCVEVKE